MKKNINSYLAFYLFVLFLFGLFFLFIKHEIGNDSTISEWIINYSGGFTKRGIIGQICIYFANLFSTNLRDIIFGFQTIILCLYFLLIYFFLKNIKFRNWKKKHGLKKPRYKIKSFEDNCISIYGSDEIWNFENKYFAVKLFT